MDVEDKEEQHEVVCPKCKNKFKIQTKCPDSDKECSWEEHGEPRKTVLSSIKPKTNKPKIAMILLLIVFIIGISTAALSEVFVETSFDVASAAGMTGSIEFEIINQSNESIENVNFTINDEKTNFSYSNVTYINKDVELGIQKIGISAEGFNDQTYEILVTPFITTEITIKMKEGAGKEELKEYDSTPCTIILAIFSIFAALASIVCLKRQHFDVALAGSFIAIFSFGFFLIGSIISIIAFVFIWKSRDEFENGKKGKTF